MKSIKIPLYSLQSIAAAPSVCLTMDETSSSSSSLPLGSGRAIDRHNPIIRDPRRLGTSPLHPSSPLPLKINIHSPENHELQNRDNRKIRFLKARNELQNKHKKKGIAEDDDNNNDGDDDYVITMEGGSCTKGGGSDFISPPGSSRYLLGSDDQAVASEIDHQLVKFVPLEVEKPVAVKRDESCYAKASCSRSPDQVVVLRVSLHCKGCERKMRKHISRMQGVSSFNIDFAAKKVIVAGDVTPLEVLASISKVKNAKLWMPPVSFTASASPLSFNNQQIRKFQEAAA